MEKGEDICEVKRRPPYKCARRFVIVINSLVLFIGLISFVVGLIFRFSNMTDRLIGSFDTSFLCLTEPDLSETTVVPLLYCNSRAELNSVFAGLIAFGYIVSVVSIVGILGAYVENIFVLRMFASIVVIILIAEAIITIMLVGRPTEVKMAVTGFIGSVLADILNRTVERQADLALNKELNNSGVSMTTILDFCDFLKTRVPGYDGPKSNFTVKIVINGNQELPISQADTEQFIKSKYPELANGVTAKTDCHGGHKWLKEAFAAQIRDSLCKISGNIQNSLNCCGLESTGLMAQLDSVYRCNDDMIGCSPAQNSSGTCRDAVWTLATGYGAKAVPIVGSVCSLVAFAQLLTLLSGFLLAQTIWRYRLARCDEDEITYVSAVDGSKVKLSVACQN